MHNPETIEPRPRGSGGPHSPQGKANSSLNRLTHGGRSQQLLLRHEDPVEFEFTVTSWFEKYQPAGDDPVACTLVEQTAHAHWVLQRNQKNLAEVDSNLPTLAYCWTDDNHKQFNNFTRYKTTAERTFFRWFKELEAYFARIYQQDRLRDRAYQESLAIQLKWLSENQENPEQRVTQMVQVHTVDAKCHTSYWPTNQEILRRVAESPAPPSLVTRFVSLPEGVPAEYAWANRRQLPLSTGPTGVLQKFTYQNWLRTIDREEAAGTGHVGPVMPYGPGAPGPLHAPLS